MRARREPRAADGGTGGTDTPGGTGGTPPTVLAAGAVLWRPSAPASASIPLGGRRGVAGGAAVEVAVIHRPKYDDWSLPKGKLDPGEHPLDAAVREVREETGQRARVGRDLGEVRYPVRRRGEARTKVVRYWAMEARGGTFTPGAEVDELRWLTPDAAAALLTHDRDRALLRRFTAGHDADAGAEPREGRAPPG